MKFSMTIILMFALLTGCAFSKKKSQAYFDAAKVMAPYDAIIVPGVPFDGETWSATMEMRVSWASYLYERGLTKNIIYSGGAVYTKYSEAKIMREYGRALGIPEANIFIDTLAEHSSENVYYSYLIAKEQGFKKVAFATDPFQAKQLKGMLRKLELPIDLLPIVLDTLMTINRPEPTINPDVAIEAPFVPITERESFFTRFKGTMGKHIKFYPEDLPDEKTVEKFRKQGRLVTGAE